MRLVGPSGLEPPTSCLSGTRSNHLSYEPLSGAAPKPGFAFIFFVPFILCTKLLFAFWFFCVRLPKRWWRWWDSNPWPPACRAGALPAELHPHMFHKWWMKSLRYEANASHSWSFRVFAFSPKDPSKLNNESIYSDKTVILCRIHIVMYGRFSIERRWSSRTFRYGYLVTT